MCGEEPGIGDNVMKGSEIHDFVIIVFGTF